MNMNNTFNDSKIKFGSKKVGRAHKNPGPKSKKVSKYNGQGR